MTTNRAFRDYATRVSFNLSLSRNQIANLRAILYDIQFQERLMENYDEHRKRQEAEGYDSGSNFIVGKRSLAAMGLIEDDPRAAGELKRLDEAEKRGERRARQYWGPMYRLTTAGEHVVELLRLAGLIHLPAANANRRRKRKAA